MHVQLIEISNSSNYVVLRVQNPIDEGNEEQKTRSYLDFSIEPVW